MSDYDISKMNYKQLRNEVQLLRDELALMKRKFEDIIYNLDDNNFSSKIIKERDKMRAEISVTAEEIRTKVSREDLNAYSTISQTAEAITTTVSKEYINSKIGDTYVTNALFQSKITQTADEIKAEVEEKAVDEYGNIYNQISTVSQTAGRIETKVSDLEKFKTSVFTQTSDGFTLDGKKTTFTGVIYLTDDNGNKKFSITHDESQDYERVNMWGCTGDVFPIVIGDVSNNVYIGNPSDENKIATQKWVKKNSATAVFG